MLRVKERFQLASKTTRISNTIKNQSLLGELKTSTTNSHTRCPPKILQSSRSIKIPNRILILTLSNKTKANTKPRGSPLRVKCKNRASLLKKE